jgi:hypothetical protein
MQDLKYFAKYAKYNTGAIEVENIPKMKPRVRQLKNKYHHFGDEVRKGAISIYHTRTKDQITEIYQALTRGASFIV